MTEQSIQCCMTMYNAVTDTKAAMLITSVTEISLKTPHLR